MIIAAGLLSGPRDILVTTLLAERAPDRYRTEVFGRLNTFMWTGYGLGTAATGAVTGPTADATAAFTIAAAVAVLGAAVAFLLHRPAPQPSRTPTQSGIG